MLERMMRLCSVSEHCRSDIRSKVAGVNPSWCDEILEKLCKDGYINEMRYATAFARDKSSLSGWGCAKIKVALSVKGIETPVIEAALQEIEPQAAQKKLSALLSAKWRALAGESDETVKRVKLFRYALGRGYEYAQIKEYYDNLRRD